MTEAGPREGEQQQNSVKSWRSPVPEQRTLPAASAFLNGSLTRSGSPGSRPGSGVLANSSAEERAGDLSALGVPRSFR